MRTLFAIIAVLALPANQASAVSDCPWNTGGSWRSYFEAGRNGIGGSAPLQFLDSSNIPADVNWKGKCHSISYWRETGTWFVSGYYNDFKWHITSGIDATGVTKIIYFDEDSQDLVEFSEGQRKFWPVSSFKFNIRGDHLTYNEAGEVYHRDYGLVGHFSCRGCE